MALEFREVTRSDAPSVLGALAPGASVETWSWLYEASPGGARALAAFEDERLVAHCGVVRHRVWAAEKERAFAELVDLHEERPGMLALCAQALLEDEPSAVVYGWPEGVPARVASKLLGFDTVRTECELVLGLDAADADTGAHTLEHLDEQARWLFDRCAGDFAAALIRDADFLGWRFRARPGVRPDVFGVRDAEGILRGLAVLEGERLVEWLVPPDERAVGDALLRAALARARASGACRVVTRLPPWSPWFAAFQEQGFRVHPAGEFLLARPRLRKLDDLTLREGWWTTPADRVGGVAG